MLTVLPFGLTGGIITFIRARQENKREDQLNAEIAAFRAEVEAFATTRNNSH